MTSAYRDWDRCFFRFGMTAEVDLATKVNLTLIDPLECYRWAEAMDLNWSAVDRGLRIAGQLGRTTLMIWKHWKIFSAQLPGRSSPVFFCSTNVWRRSVPVNDFNRWLKSLSAIRIWSLFRWII